VIILGTLIFRHLESIVMKTGNSMINNLTTGNVTRQLLRFAFPFALSNLLQVTFNLVDMIIIGQHLGSGGLSAVSIGGDLLAFCMMLGIGFSNAGQVMISQYVGLNDRKAISRTIGTMFTFILSLAVIISLIAICMLDVLLRVMNTPAAVYSQAKGYAIICFLGLIFTFGYSMISAILRGMGDSRRPFVFIAIAAVLNVVLTYLFVMVFEIGAAGAALGTVIGQAVSFIISLIYLYIKRESFGFDFRLQSFKIDSKKLLPLIKLGFPLAMQNAAVMISMMFINSYVNSYGVVASAVTGVGNKLRGVMSIISNAIGAAGSSMIGQNLGAKKLERVQAIVKTILIICLTACLAISTLFILFSKDIFRIFDSNPEVLAWAPTYMWVLAVYFLTFATMAPFQALINGLGHAVLSFVMGFMDGVVTRIGLAVLLGIVFKMGIVGFWLGSAAAGFTTAIIGAIYYYSGRWKRRKLLID
jgi:putative MATE family efflux protein